MTICGDNVVEGGIIKRNKKQRVLLCNKISFIKPDGIHGGKKIDEISNPPHA